MDEGFVLLDSSEDKHVLPLSRLRVGERVIVGHECCVKWSNPPQMDMNVEWCERRDSAIDKRNMVSLTTPHSVCFFVFGKRVESITYVFIIDYDHVVFFVNTGNTCGLILNNRFFETDHLLTAGSKNNVCCMQNVIDFGQPWSVDLCEWKDVSSFFKPAVRESDVRFKIHTAVIEAKSPNNVYWDLKDGRLSVSYIKDGSIITIYHDDVVGEDSCGSL